MSVPRARATDVATISAGVVHWSVMDDRIGVRSEAFAVDGASGRIVVDPLPLTARAERTLGSVEAIVLTVGTHQRASWELRRRLGVAVWAPSGAKGLDEHPDRSYEAGSVLPGRLEAVAAPGPKGPHFVLKACSEDSRIVLFTGDLFLRRDDGPLELLPDEHLADPCAARHTAASLPALRPDIVCPGHGPPVLIAAAAALASAANR